MKEPLEEADRLIGEICNLLNNLNARGGSQYHSTVLHNMLHSKEDAAQIVEQMHEIRELREKVGERL